MKFYDIAQRGKQSLWGAMVTNEEAERLALEKNITFRSFWENPQTIPMMLRSSHAEITGEDIVIQDYYTWDHDILFHTAPKPAAKLMIISSKLKKVFEGLSIPSHTYYKVEIPNAGEEQYYIIHFKGIRSVINHSQITFYVQAEITKKVIKEYPLGEIKTIEELEERQDEVNLSEDVLAVKPSTYTFDKEYDLIPTPMAILISEKGKQAVEEACCEGFTFFEYNKTGRETPLVFPEKS